MKSKQIIFKITSEEGGPDIGVAILDKETISVIRVMRKELTALQKKFGKDVKSIGIMNYACKPLEQSTLDGLADEEHEECERVRSEFENDETHSNIERETADALLEDESQIMDRDGLRLHIDENHFYWSGTSGEINWETYPIPYSVLD